MKQVRSEDLLHMARTGIAEASPVRLLGRKYELRVLEDLLASTRNRVGGAIVVRGEPGIGKTALIDTAAHDAVGFTVLRTAGNEAEMELAYAGLQDLLRGFVRDLGELAPPQRAAIEVVLGRLSGDAPDQLLVGLGLLNLLSGSRPNEAVLCVVDDAQWLDAASAHAIAFAARHVSHDPVAFVLAERDRTSEFRGLPELAMLGLGDQDARELIAISVPDRIDDQVANRLIAETRGNPLALVQLPRGMTPAQLAGGFGLPMVATLADRIEGSYRQRLATLPSDSAKLLLLSASDPTGDSRLIWRAADRLAVAESAAEALEVDGLVEFGARIVFSHPLVRSAVYSAASPSERREVHRALADATDVALDPDRRAWHRAQATVHPDESVARELEDSAARAQARGGFAAAGAFLERSAALTSDPRQRAPRALRAAQAKRQAGAIDSATGLAKIAQRGPLSDRELAQLDALLGQIAFARHRGNEVAPLLLKAAARLEHVDVQLARYAYLDALIAAIFAGHLAGETGPAMVARAVRAARTVDESLRPADLLADGLALLLTDGYQSATPALKAALAAFRGQGVSSEERLRWSWLAGGTAGLIWDYETWDVLTARQERFAREVGALSGLPIALSIRVGVCLFSGDMVAARFLLEQVQVVTDASDGERFPNAAVLVAAFSGDGDETRPLIETVMSNSLARGEGLAMTMAWCATAVLCNGNAQYEEAFAAALAAVEDPSDIWYWGWSTVELIEAASRTGRAAEAKPHLERLIQSTDASGTPWALAVQARCRALLADGTEAEGLFRKAIELASATPVRLEVARSTLVYGEWLRRHRRTRDARVQLRVARELFMKFGMSGFARRAEGELLASGDRIRTAPAASTNLTPQENRIAELAARGSTNQDIAEQLFISRATVEYHLSKVYRKLGVKTRTQLANTLRLP